MTRDSIRWTIVAMFTSGCLIPLAYGQSAYAVSRFDLGTEGWRVADLPQSLGNPPPVVSYFDLEWSATGGNPFGYVHKEDPSSEWFWFSAPANFLGDKSGTYGTSLSFDLASTGSDGVPYAGVILVGAGYALYRELQPPAPGFTRYEVPLVKGEWKVGAVDGATASDFQIQQVLGALTALYINADWETGYETTSLDNVVLAPEPAALVLGLCGVLILTRRPRQHGLAA